MQRLYRTSKQLSDYCPILPVGGEECEATVAVFGHQEHTLALQAHHLARLQVRHGNHAPPDEENGAVVR